MLDFLFFEKQPNRDFVHRRMKSHWKYAKQKKATKKKRKRKAVIFILIVSL